MKLRAAIAVLALLALGASGCDSSSSTPQRSSAPVTAPPSGSGRASPTGSASVVLLSHLDGATVPTSFTLEDDTAGVTEARFYLRADSKQFLGRVTSAPFRVSITVPAGPASIEVRHEVDGSSERVTVRFTARTGGTNASASNSGSGSALPAPPQRRVPLVVPAPTVRVSNADQLAAALAAARPGSVIALADGQYQNKKGDRWALSASGTAAEPIFLVGGRGAVLQSDSPTGDYGLWITGSYWRVVGLSVRNATKGIVLDGSQHTVIDRVEVGNIGEEGVHFRTCSSDDVLQNSYVHDTGIEKPQFGEGVYVGSANSNWSKYHCDGGRDDSERDLVIGNTFRHIAAEGADLKEGTDSGALVGNVFADTGYSGQNSADSAVDVKGNGWTITANIATEPEGADLDAFQTHTVYSGYGTGNTFAGNVVEGKWRGFGIGMYPRAANVVSCSNRAQGAAKGLAGADGKSVACTP